MRLINTKNLHGFKIHAIDGELGTADEFYFDDESWTIRYLTVKTGGWLSGREVLISPISIIEVDLDAKRVNVSLTKDKVKHSPDIDTQKPVSRQHESAYLGYYGYPNYWGGPYLWGPAYTPSELTFAAAGMTQDLSANSVDADSHLRNTNALCGYKIHTHDGELGHVKAFVIDEATWTISYMEVSTGHWWPGKSVLVAPSWIGRMSWIDSEVFVTLTRELIRSAPEYLESKPITREYEDRLYMHYAKACYWRNQAAAKSYFAMSGR